MGGGKGDIHSYSICREEGTEAGTAQLGAAAAQTTPVLLQNLLLSNLERRGIIHILPVLNTRS